MTANIEKLFGISRAIRSATLKSIDGDGVVSPLKRVQSISLELLSNDVKKDFFSVKDGIVI